jgi:hypothetical protein
MGKGELGSKHARATVPTKPLHYGSVLHVPLHLGDFARVCVQGDVPDDLEHIICLDHLEHPDPV